MAAIIFSDICLAFKKYTKLNKDKCMTPIARRLLDYFTLNENIKNEKGEEYIIQPKEYIQFFKGEKDIYPNIKNGLNLYEIVSDIELSMSDAFDDLIFEDNYVDLATELLNLLENDEFISKELKEEIQEIDINDPYTIVAKVFIYALKNNNDRNYVATPKIEKRTINDTIKSINDLFEKLPEKVVLDIPSDVTDQELNYVREILDAISERTGVSLSVPSDLKSNPALKKYSDLFDRSRREYYAAEGIRESLKDTGLMDEKNEFEVLKNEAHDAVVDLFVDYTYSDSLECMIKVLNHITHVELRSLIATIPGWVQVSEKKGLCHILVNEKEMTWKDE